MFPLKDNIDEFIRVRHLKKFVKLTGTRKDHHSTSSLPAIERHLDLIVIESHLTSEAVARVKVEIVP